MPSGLQLYTTGQVAKMCGFSTSAVLQWIHAGKLSTYHSPGGQNRIAPKDLLKFMKAHDMRIPADLEKIECANATEEVGKC